MSFGLDIRLPRVYGTSYNLITNLPKGLTSWNTQHGLPVKSATSYGTAKRATTAKKI